MPESAVIKLLICIPTLDRSGAEKQFGLLATRLPADQYEIRVAALNRGGPYADLLRQRGIPVDVLHKRWRLDPVTILRLREILRDWEPDVVVSALFAANTTVRLATLGLHPRPAVIVSERCVDSWKSGWQLWLDRKLASRTDRMAANSRSVEEFYTQQGFPREKIAVIPNGVEIPPFPKIPRDELCRQLQLPEDARLVAYVGRLAHQKRVRNLIWAAQLLRQVDEKAYLLIIGDGPERDDLELYAEDVEVSRHVRFLGHREDGASLLHLVDVFWLASEFEGMSNSLMEAMACGKPVVVSDIPPNRELVTHGQEGWIVNLGDSVGFSQFTLRLLADPELSARMGAAGREKMLQEFSIDRMIERYANLIRETSSVVSSGLSRDAFLPLTERIMAQTDRDWNERYRTGELPWDSGRPSRELVRVMEEFDIPRGHALELGCGTGTNAVWLARQGFDVTAVDCAPLALQQARDKAALAGVTVNFVEADVQNFGAGLTPVTFFFDRGCYHCCRRVDLNGYLQTLRNVSQRGTWGLILAGNANEGVETGPPRVTETELRAELGEDFEIVRLQEFRFQEADGSDGPLGWSILLLAK